MRRCPKAAACAADSFVVIFAAVLYFTPDSITEVIIAGDPKTDWIITKCGPHMLGEFG